MKSRPRHPHIDLSQSKSVLVASPLDDRRTPKLLHREGQRWAEAQARINRNAMTQQLMVSVSVYLYAMATPQLEYPYISRRNHHG
jgi:hypothetical protein